MGEFDRLFERTRCAFAQERTFERARTLAISSLVGLGRKVTGAGRRRDPLGPAFCTNFVWGRRFLQLSAALPETGEIGRARAVPIDLMHAPSPVRPGKNASNELLAEYREKQKLMKISCVGARRIAELRAMMDKENKENIRLIVAVDGGFTNRAVLRNLPHDTVAIGRIRKDARLFHLPTNKTGTTRGRRRWYGAALPTPEEIRQDELIPWVSVEAFAAGKTHSFQVKTLASVRWAVTGQLDVRRVVIRPLAYRPRKGSKLLYRDPAYLICTDPDLPLHRLIQSYLWRWEIELNFRFVKGAKEVWFCTDDGNMRFFNPLGELKRSELFGEFPGHIVIDFS